MKLRRLNEEGIRRMGEFLDSLTGDEPQPYPATILQDTATSERLTVEIPVEQREFPRRYEAAEYLYQRLFDSGVDYPERDAGLWAWLALFWFEQLCPTASDGRKTPKDRARWIPELDNPRRYYRHLILGPYLIYTTHRDRPTRAMALLGTTISAPGEIVEQIASRAKLITCPAAVGAATRMYWQPQGGFRKGAAGSEDTPGSSRRLASVLMQFDLTFDLHRLNENQLMTLLPHEFDRFKK